MAERRDPDADAESILQRRALLVSSLLTALGCSPAAAPDGASSTPPPTTVDVPPVASASAPLTASAAPEPGPSVAWSALMSDAPPLDVSKKLGAAEASQRQKVVDDVTKVYEALRVLYEAPPPVCDLREDECKPKWTAAAKELLRIEDAVPKPRDFGLCGYPPPDLLDETMELGAAHEAFLREGLIPKVRALLDARAARTGVLSLQVWLKHSARPKPGVLLMPCLSCVAPQSFHFGAGISFTEGSSSLDAAGQAEVQRLADVLKTHKASDVTVRGHCDPGEADAARLSLSRAVAVQSALANEGIDKARVKVLGSGSELTVASSKTEGGRAQNRKAWVGSIRYQ